METEPAHATEKPHTHRNTTTQIKRFIHRRKIKKKKEYFNLANTPGTVIYPRGKTGRQGTQSGDTYERRGKKKKRRKGSLMGCKAEEWKENA